ncbi:MAG: hypothetical protein OHK0029_01090 [Armatimonadaceae bacterium]
MSLLLIAFVAISGVPCQANADLSETIFYRALQEISTASRVFVVTEGTPLEPNAKKEAVERILSDTRATTREKLQRLANLFDYDLLTVNGCYAMSKRYTELNDIPCITLEELEEGLANASRIANSLCPPSMPPLTNQEKEAERRLKQNAKNNSRWGMGGHYLYSYRLVQALTPQQKKVLVSQGVPVGALNSTQKKHLENLLVYAQLSSISSLIGNDLPDLKMLPESKIISRSTKDGSKTGILYPYPLKKSQMLFRAFSFPREEMVQASLAEPLSQQQIQRKTFPLSFLIQRLNEKAKSSSASGQAFRVAPALANKPILFVGESHASEIRILRAVALLFGLKRASLRSEGRTSRGRGFTDPSKHRSSWIDSG